MKLASLPLHIKADMEVIIAYAILQQDPIWVSYLLELIVGTSKKQEREILRFL